MTMIRVYSKSPISHVFSIVENKIEKSFIIEGTNKLGVVSVGTCVPKMTEMQESTFNAIKSKYCSHVKLFGGENLNGSIVDPMIWAEKDDITANKRMRDLSPVLTDNEIVTKTKGIKENKG